MTTTCCAPFCSTQLYALNVPASAIRAKVRQEFERNRHVDDLEAADILLLKGYQEFQEVSLCSMFSEPRCPDRSSSLCCPPVLVSRLSTAGRWRGTRRSTVKITLLFLTDHALFLVHSHVMRWFAAEEVRTSRVPKAVIHTLTHAHVMPSLPIQLPARPDNFLDAFYLSRDDPAAIQPTA